MKHIMKNVRALGPVAYGGRKWAAGDEVKMKRMDARLHVALKNVEYVIRDRPARVPQEKVAPTPTPSAPEVPDQREALRARAARAGITVDGRWSAERLQEEIDTASKSKPAEPMTTARHESLVGRYDRRDMRAKE